MERTVTHSFLLFSFIILLLLVSFFLPSFFCCFIVTTFFYFRLSAYQFVCPSVCLCVSLYLYIDYTNRNLIYFQLKFSLIFINFFHSLVQARTSSVQKWVCTYNEQSRRKWAGESKQYAEEHYLLKNILREICFSCRNNLFLFITKDLFSFA